MSSQMARFFFIFIFLNLFLFMAVLGLRFCARAFSSCSERGPLFIVVRGPVTIAASRCRAQAPDAQAQQLWLTGLVAPRHVGSSQTRARTRVPCIGRQTPNHCATREAPFSLFLNLIFILFVQLTKVIQNKSVRFKQRMCLTNDSVNAVKTSFNK